MKSTVNNKPCKAVLPFPKLMANADGQVVLFSGPTSGVVVHPVIHTLGYFSSAWNKENWHDFTGSVCLENE